MWETAGGCVVAGEEGIAVAIKEVREELGIELNPANGRFFSRHIYCHANGSGAIVDSWLFRQDVDLADITLCPDENCDVMLANRDKIRELAALGQIVPYPNLEELFEASYLSVS
jgi:8-oxo-dGTP pyrophosphatase MutT (NUDIX family)